MAISLINEGRVSRAVINQRMDGDKGIKYELILHCEDKKKMFALDSSSEIIRLLNKKKVPFNIEAHKGPNNLVSSSMRILQTNLHSVGMIAIMALMLNRLNSMQNLMKGKVGSKIRSVKTGVKFSDVAGVDEAKVEIMEFVDFLKNGEKYRELGAKMPRGALLTGPPGAGKTLLAKACAGEAGVPFFALSGSEIVELYVGVGARKVRNLFKDAKKHKNSIIFIDEIDAIGKKRNEFSSGESNKTLNQLLVEMDGFEPSTGVIVFAATNVPETLDSALTRPGRFDRTIQFTLPDKQGRQEILRVHMKKLTLIPGDFDRLITSVAALTAGFSGAELANLCNEAAMIAARAGQDFVLEEHFEKAAERVLGGIEASTPLSEKVRHRVAVFEAGKAIASWFLEHVPQAIKLSVVPRAKSKLGLSQFLRSDPKLETTEQLKEKLAFKISGKVAEELILKESSSVSSKDLTDAYSIAKKIVESFGMIPELSNIAPEHVSQQTSHLIDQSIVKLLDEAADLARKVLEPRTDLILAVAGQLEEKDTLNHMDLVRILGEKPFESSEEYKKFRDEVERRQQVLDSLKKHEAEPATV